MADWVTTVPRTGHAPHTERAGTWAPAETAPVAGGRAWSRLVIPRIPAHVVALVGLTTCGYAVSLTAVTALQSSTDAATAAAQAPLASAIAGAATQNDALAADLSAASARQGQATDAYQAVLDAVAPLESALADLSSSVTAVDGASRALPSRVALPTAVRTVIRATTSASGPVHATTGGSGKP